MMPYRPDGCTSAARHYHIKALSVRTLKIDVRTVELVHAIFIYEAWSFGPWRLTSGRLNLIYTFLPYRGHRPDGITHRPDGSSRLPITVSWGRNPNSCQTLNGVGTICHYVWTDAILNFSKLLDTDGRLDGIPHHPNGWRGTEINPWKLHRIFSKNIAEE